MLYNLSVRELLDSGVAIAAHEAVAIVQQLIHIPRAEAQKDRPLGPATMDNVVLAADGSVGCRGYAAAPAIADVAALLGAMLPENTIAVSDELRTTIARVLGIVDPPPFESVEALSRSLEQFETGDRREVVRQLLARTPFGKPAAAARPAPGETTFVERRRGGTPRSELRRQLREADRRLYEEQQRRAETPPSADAEAATRGRVRF